MQIMNRYGLYFQTFIRLMALSLYPSKICKGVDSQRNLLCCNSFNLNF